MMQIAGIVCFATVRTPGGKALLHLHPTLGQVNVSLICKRLRSK